MSRSQTHENEPAGAPGPDRWAHRRGEPRTFAAAWLFFIIGASLVTIGSAGARGLMSWEVYRPAARVMLAVVGVGVGVLWPMLRLAQEWPPKPGRSVALDALIITLPAQLMIWPQAWAWMADWPVAVVGALAASQAAWTLVTGGVLVLAMKHAARARGEHAELGRRVAWTVVFVLLSMLAPGVGWMLGGTPALASSRVTTDAPDAWSTASPVTAPFELGKDRAWTGVSARVGRVHWRVITLETWAGACVWAFAGLARVAPGGRRA